MKTAADILRTHRIRVTRTAEQVFEILQESHQPLTAEAIYLKLRETETPGTLSTVYRTLERLEEKGLAHKHPYLADGKNLYELSEKGHHHYFRCIGCGKLWPVDTCPVHEVIHEMSERLGVQITGHKLELSGYCKGCKKAERIRG